MHLQMVHLDGGATQSRTGLDGFAIRCITDLLSRQIFDKKGKPKLPFLNGAGKESRTLDLNLGKVALYQLSYSRIQALNYSVNFSAFESV